MATRSKRKKDIKVVRLVAQAERAVANQDCVTSARLIERASSALEKAAGQTRLLKYVPGYGRLLRAQAQHQVSCKRPLRWKLY